MSSDTSLPVDLEDRLRTYFGAFLPGTAVEEAVDELVADLEYWHDVDEVSAFRTAHLLLAGRVRVAADVEALVLHDDADLPVPAVGRVLGMPESDIRRLLDAALIELGEAPAASPLPREPGANTIRIDALEGTDAPEGRSDPAAATDPPARSPRRRLLVGLFGALLIGAVVTGVVLAAGGATGCADAAAVGIVDARLTTELDASGAPGGDQDRFVSDDPVVLWISFRSDDTTAGTVTVRWTRAGVELYGTEVRLPDAGSVGVSLSRTYAAPGSYEVEVREGSCVLLERRFEIVATP